MYSANRIAYPVTVARAPGPAQIGVVAATWETCAGDRCCEIRLENGRLGIGCNLWQKRARQEVKREFQLAIVTERRE